MNYDTYNWSFDPKNAPKGGSGDNIDPWAGVSIGTCIGAECCDPDQTYDTVLDKCITGKTESFEMPSYVASLEDKLYSGLTKMAPNKYKADVNLKESFSAYNS